MVKSRKVNKHIDLNARMSDVSYQRYAATRRKWIKDINQDHKTNFKLDNELSSKFNAVVHDKNTGKTYVSYRGTKLNEADDLINDALLVLGREKLGKRYADSLEHIDKVIDKYGKDNLIITGHSLGTVYGNAVARKHDLEAHLFSPASVFNQTRERVIEDKHLDRDNKITTYHSSGFDPISHLSTIITHDDIVKVPQKEDTSSHSLSNFFAD